MWSKIVRELDLPTFVIYHKWYYQCAGSQIHLGMFGPDGTLSILIKSKVVFHRQKGLVLKL